MVHEMPPPAVTVRTTVPVVIVTSHEVALVFATAVIFHGVPVTATVTSARVPSSLHVTNLTFAAAVVMSELLTPVVKLAVELHVNVFVASLLSVNEVLAEDSVYAVLFGDQFADATDAVASATTHTANASSATFGKSFMVEIARFLRPLSAGSGSRRESAPRGRSRDSSDGRAVSWDVRGTTIAG